MNTLQWLYLGTGIFLLVALVVGFGFATTMWTNTKLANALGALFLMCAVGAVACIVSLGFILLGRVS